MLSILKRVLHSLNIHPKKWRDSLVSYPRYLGYIKPRLLASCDEDYIIRRKALSNAWEPRHLTLPVGKRILSISVHPDDESIGAGGLLWAHRNISELHLIALSRGEKGGALEEKIVDPALYETKLAEVRKAEFSRTASMLGARSCHFFDFPDGQISFGHEHLERLGALVKQIKPDIVLLPWFLDNWSDHRRANILYSWACSDLELIVLAYEVWTMLEPNAVLDITDYLEGKLSLVRNYPSQLRTVDYESYCVGISQVRAFQFSPRPKRSGAQEAYLSLPNQEYCALVHQYYGKPGQIKKSAYALIDM
jgi:LmbE family N-acetylglucosaminyl deacetylase